MTSSLKFDTFMLRLKLGDRWTIDGLLKIVTEILQKY